MTGPNEMVHLCHLAGVPSSSAADLPADVAARAWPNVLYRDGDARFADLELRALAAAARYPLTHSTAGCPWNDFSVEHLMPGMLQNCHPHATSLP